MCVESTIPLVMESITAPKAVIPVHQARSHDEFRPPDLNFTVYAAMTIVSQMEGSGRPERHRRRSDLLRTCHRHQVGTARPKARSDRRKCSGGSADGRVQSSVHISELLQSAARCAKSSRVSKRIIVKVVPYALYTQASGGPGKPLGDYLYLAGSGAPPAAVLVSRRPWTVPTTFPGEARCVSHWDMNV